MSACQVVLRFRLISRVLKNKKNLFPIPSIAIAITEGEDAAGEGLFLPQSFSFSYRPELILTQLPTWLCLIITAADK